jgi:MFS family permease
VSIIETSHDSGLVLGQRPFALFWFARIASILSFQMLAVAVGWQLYALTGSALDLGLIGLAQFVPMVVLTLLVGHVADRHEHRLILVTCQLVEAVAAAILVFETATGQIDRLSIFVLMAAVGAARAFELPTMAAIIPSLVPRALVPVATAWSASANQTAQIVGPAVGGLLYMLGPVVVYATGIVCWCAGSALIAMIPADRRERLNEPFNMKSLLGGFHFVKNDRVVLGILSLDLFAVLLGGATALLPIFARDVLGTGPWGLGLLRSAPAAGALAMSLVLARRPLEPPVGPTLFRVLLAFGAATIVFGLSTHLVLSLCALAVLGAADVVSVVIRFSLVQLRTPDAMRGRVSAVNALFVGTTNTLGDFESGVVAALLGAVPAVVIGGVGTIAVAVIWMMVLFPELRRLHSFEDIAATPAVDTKRGGG